MALLGAHRFAVILCKCSDVAAEPQSIGYYRALFTSEDPRIWATPIPIEVLPDPKAPATAGVAVVARYPEHVDVFWAGNDGAIWTNWWDSTANGGNWNQPFRIAPPGAARPGSPVTAVARFPDHLDVFWAGNEGAIWSNWWDAHVNSGGWNAPFPITGAQAAPPGAVVACIARRPNHLDVFWADNGGAIGTQWWDGDDPNGPWNRHSPFRITAPGVLPPGGGVAVTARYPEHIDVFWADNGGAVGTHWWDGIDPGGGWDRHTPFRITGTGVLPPGGGVAAVARYPEHLDVFWADNGGAVGTHWWDGIDPGGAWDRHAPFTISARKSVQPGAPVAAVARYPDHLDVFWPDSSGAVGSNWWDVNSNNQQWNTPFLIGSGSIIGGTAALAAVARRPEHLDVFWADLGGTISSSYWPGPSPWGLPRFWWDMSYGQFSMEGSIFGWYTIPKNANDFRNLNRNDKIEVCVQAARDAGVDMSPFLTTVAIINTISDSGTSAKRTILDPLALTHGWAAHETGHDLGLDHSWDDTTNACSGSPGEYQDGWDIMSFACFGSETPQFNSPAGLGPTGPGLHAPYRDQLGWIPAERITEVIAVSGFRTVLPIASLNHIEANGFLLVRLFPNPDDRNNYLTLQFRTRDGWDGAIARDTVLVHRMKNNTSYLIRGYGGPEHRPGQHLDIFWPEQNGAVLSTWWNSSSDDSAWTNPQFTVTSPSVVPPTASMAAVARYPNHLDVFWADNGGGIGTTWWDLFDPNGAWTAHTPFRITAAGVTPSGAGVAAVARHRDHLDVFWADNGGAIGTNWWDAFAPDGGWDKHSPFRITPAGVVPPGAGVAAVARYPEHLDVFWIGNNGAVSTDWWDSAANSGSWNTPFPISGEQAARPGASVAAVCRYPDHLDVFWAGNDGAIWTTWWDVQANNGQWNAPFPITPPNSAPAGAGVSAVSRFPDHLDVFWIDNSGAVRSAWWDARQPLGGWDKHPDFPVSPAGAAPPGAPVSAVSRRPERLDVFWASSDNAVRMTWWDGQDADGAWNGHSVVPVNAPGAVSSGATIAAVPRYGDEFLDFDDKLRVRVLQFYGATATVELEFL